MSPDAEDSSSSPESDQENDNYDESFEMAETNNAPTHAGKGKRPASKGNPKDPSRPRRKKARRACHACQRAHLTCGDERPCTRCIKRGLQDQCQDGVRKKAKYLHDAPSEALVPGFAADYHLNGPHAMPSVATGPPMASNSVPLPQPATFFPQNAPSGYQQYGPITDPAQMAVEMTDNSNMMSDFPHQLPVQSPVQFQPTQSQLLSPAQNMNPGIDPSSALAAQGNAAFDPTFVDQDEMRFNPREFNFGNHYGALEFGMLGHLSSGAVGNPDLDMMNAIAQGNMAFDGSAGFIPTYNYNQPVQPVQPVQPWQNVPNAVPRQGSTSNFWTPQKFGMDTFPIGNHAPSLTGTSPLAQTQDFSGGYQSATLSPETQFAHLDPGRQQQELLRQSLSQAQQRQRRGNAFPSEPTQTGPKRRRDAEEIYESVKAPYPYTQKFHLLIAAVQNRFSSNTVLSIAKSLAAIRPSFIACNRNLNDHDLIFVEQGFQRSLLEYEHFLAHSGTPTVIIRRTGEIAHATKEFSIISRWPRNVLLGYEPNANINVGKTASGTQTGASTRGAVTPRMVPAVETNNSQPQPVFLTEIFDEETLVQFYEDFAELAFGASQGSIIGGACGLMEYITEADVGRQVAPVAADSLAVATDATTAAGNRNADSSRSDALLANSSEGTFPPAVNGKISCQLSWTVKRDMFDIPMLIVINILPWI